jgi:hypothetical protein
MVSLAILDARRSDGRHRGGVKPGSDETFCAICEAIFFGREDILKRRPAIKDLDQTMRFGHVGIHHQLVLPPVLQKLLERHAMEWSDEGGMMCGTKARGPCC